MYQQLFASLVFTVLVTAEVSDEWVIPPRLGAIGEYISDLSFLVGQSITLQWQNETRDDSLSLWLMQDSDLGDCGFQSNAFCSLIAVLPNNGSLPWKVSRLGIEGSDIYYISAYIDEQPTNSASDEHFNCHYFNITDAAASTKDAAKSTPTTPSTTSSFSTPTALSTVVPSPESEGSPVPVGMIVGGVVGGLAVLVVGTLGALYIRRSKKQNYLPDRFQGLRVNGVSQPGKAQIVESELHGDGKVTRSELNGLSSHSPSELP